MYSVLFVTPCYKRYALTKICLTQHKWVHEQLALKGVKSDTVVVADDANLDTARDLGFHTVDSPNDYLGKKFNDGHEFGAKSGFNYLAPVGSDMFLDPMVYVNLHEAFISTNYYAVMNHQGTRFAKMHIDWGVLQIFPSSWTNSLQNRPCIDTIMAGCDTYTRVRMKKRNKCEVVYQHNHPLECVSFQSNESQITNFGKLCKTYSARVTTGPIEVLLEPLRHHFRDEDVDRVTDYYVNGQSMFK